jgi:hypothetical protein
LSNKKRMLYYQIEMLKDIGKIITEKIKEYILPELGNLRSEIETVKHKVEGLENKFVGLENDLKD